MQVCTFPLQGVNYSGLKALQSPAGLVKREAFVAINMTFNQALQVQNDSNLKVRQKPARMLLSEYLSDWRKMTTVETMRAGIQVTNH